MLFQKSILYNFNFFNINNNIDFYDFEILLFRALRILNADFSTLKNTKCFYSFKSF